MKAVILAGGYGTRISEETYLKPKPMVEIGSRPILWHIMKIFSHYGVTDFVVCLGYKGYVIKEYFANYALHMSDVTLDVASGEALVHRAGAEPWRVTLVDTGQDTDTGGRVGRISHLLQEDERFLLTYGDGLADVDLAGLLSQHEESGKSVTVTAVQPPGRFGALNLDGASVRSFDEKPVGDGGWVSGGFFAVDVSVLRMIRSDDVSWEGDVLPKLAHDGALGAFYHRGFWQAMDTLRDKNHLEEQWLLGQANWKVWP